MRRIVLLLALLASGALGQTITSVSLVPAFGSVQVFLTTSVTGVVKVEWGTTTSLGTYFNRNFNSSATASTHWVVGPLVPSTVYYMKLTAPDASVTDCNTNPATGTGVGCHAGSGAYTFTTPAAPAGLGTVASVQRPDVSALLTDAPTTTLSAITSVVASDFSSLTTAVANCATNVNGTPNSVQEIKVPPGTYVSTTGGINLPAINSGSWCILSIDDLTKIPPAGVQITPNWAANLPIIEATVYRQGQVDYFLDAALRAGASVRGWYVRGINFRQQRSWLYTPTEYTVTAVSSNGSLVTLSTPPDRDIALHTLVQVYGITGTGWPDPPNGIYQLSASCPTLSGGANCAGGVPPQTIQLAGVSRGTGTWTGGGKVRMSVATEVCGVSNTTPIIVTTCRDHGISERTAIPITSITSGVMVLPTGHGIPNESTRVVVAGSSVPAWNGRVTATSSAATTLTISGGGALGDCAASCGTVKLLQPLGVKFVGGTTNANGPAYYEVVDSTHLRLIDKAGNGAWTSGGIVAQEPVFHTSIVATDKESSDIYFDRCLWSGGWPSRVGHSIDFQCSNCGILNSYFDDQQYHRLTRPDINTRTVLYTTSSADPWYTATMSAVDSTHGANKIVQNTTFDAHGITFFMQDSSDVSRFPTNYLLRRVKFTANSTEKAAGNTGADGFYYPHRHHLEWKRGTRTELDGVIFENTWTDYNACGPAMMITPTLANGYIQDIYTHNTTFQNLGGEAFFMIPISVNTFHPTPTATTNVRFDNMLFRNMQYIGSTPRDPAVTHQQCVRPFRTDAGYPANVQIEHITAEMPKGGNITRWVSLESGGSYAGLGGGGWTVRNNIAYIFGTDSQRPLPHLTLANATYGTNVVCKQCSPEPGTAATNILAFQQAFGTLSTFSHNTFIPGRRTGTGTSTATGVAATSNSTWSYSDCALNPPTNYTIDNWANFKGIRCIANPTNGQSEDDKEAYIKFQDAANGNFRLRHDSPALASVSRAVPITGAITAGVATVAAGHGIQVGYVGSISGSGTVAHNGVTATVTAIAATTITLSGLTGNCASSCGTFTSADAAVTSDGKDPGVDMDTLESAQGKVRNARALVTGSTTATVAYTAPDTTACTLEYGTSATWGTGTRTGDGGGVPYRALNLTGLTTGTTYYYRVLCAVEQPSGSFRTN